MKKLFAVILIICMMTALLSTTAVGSSADVLRVNGQKKDGTLVALKTYTIFDDGWNEAMEKAIDQDWMNDEGYVRIVVDLLADWNAVEGEFTEDYFNGKGFNWDAIYIYDEARITLNLNGHTINRGLTDWEYNGEVIYVDEDADFVINGGKNAEDPQTGTITGGFSCNGAGGIHVNDGAKVTLNNVNLVGNAVEDDTGSAIAIFDGATLTMNGGCISNNRLTQGADFFSQTEGTVYVNDSDATFNRVKISENIGEVFYFDGLAVSAVGSSTVTLNECVIENNGLGETEDGSIRTPFSIFYTDDKNCQLTLNKSIIRNNVALRSVFYTAGPTTISECTFSGNDAEKAFFRLDYNNKLLCEVKSSTFTDNPAALNHITSGVLEADCKLVFSDCTFNNNGTKYGYALQGDSRVVVKLVDCDLGDSVLKNQEHIDVVDTDAKKGIASIFGNGSLTLIVAFLSFFISVVAIGVAVGTNKKKAGSTNAAEEERNEE